MNFILTFIFQLEYLMENPLGLHYIVEYRGCSEHTLTSVDSVEKVMIEAVKKADATYVSHEFHQFQPVGVSGVIIIAESHFTIHTWPEKAYAALDIFTCGDMEAKKAISFLKQCFEADDCEIKILTRNS